MSLQSNSQTSNSANRFITVDFTAVVQAGENGMDVRCVPAVSDDLPLNMITNGAPTEGWFERAAGAGDIGGISGNRTFEIGAGTSTDYVLACAAGSPNGAAFIHGRTMTALFTPAP